MSELTSPRGRPGFYLHVVPAVLYVATIFYGGVARNVPDLLFHETLVPPDKLLHFLAFGGMQIVLFRAIRFVKPELSLARLLFWSVVATSAAGALLEFVQAAIPYRDAEFFDWVADTLGALVAMSVVRFIFRRWFGEGSGEAGVRAAPGDSPD